MWQWLWRKQEIGRVRTLIAADGARQQRLQRARLAAEAADRVFDPVEPLAFASTVPLALSFYREAAYWALLAQDTSLEAADLPGALAGSAPTLLAFAAGGEKRLARLRRDFADKTFVDLAALDERELAELAQAVRTFVHALLSLRTESEQRLDVLRRQRRRRVLLATLVLVASVVGGLVLYSRLTKAPDLALGKPWRTSSKLADCQPQIERCAGARTKIFFSTLPEENPWFELDLGRAYDISVVDIDNRTDCCIDRARGLTVELSSDGRNWVTVARQPQSFHFWVARFPSRPARYVRLSVPRKTVLHLERVAVRQR
jgi:hypothetical protein